MKLLFDQFALRLCLTLINSQSPKTLDCIELNEIVAKSRIY